MTITPNWRTGERGVAAFDQWCIARSWPMVRVPAERDVGIDGFVQVTDGSGRATGEIFAVQVKSGTSYERSDGGSVPVDQHGPAWKNATVPVIAIVVDHKGQIWWGNATQALQEVSDLAHIATTSVLPEPEADPMPLLRSIRLSADFRGALPKSLGAPDERELLDAVWQCFALGFQSPYALIALRRMLVSLPLSVRREAIYVLSHCISHPDIFWHERNHLPDKVRRQVAAEMHWTTPEVRALLGCIDDEGGIDRGSIGQSIVLMLFEDANVQRVLVEVATDSGASDEAAWASYLAMVRIDESEQLDAWAELLRRQPRIRETFLYGQINEQLNEFGYITLGD